MRALVTADVPTLQRLYAKDYELVTPSGDVLARDDFLASVADGEIDFRRFETVAPMQVRVEGSLRPPGTRPQSISPLLA
jgi:hypothetical protein